MLSIHETASSHSTRTRKIFFMKQLEILFGVSRAITESVENSSIRRREKEGVTCQQRKSDEH